MNRAVVAATLLAAIAPLPAPARPALPPPAASQTLEAEARDLYIWGFPLVEAARIRLVSSVPNPANPASLSAPIHRIANGRVLANPGSRIGVGPNNDTLYSLVKLDMAQGPFVFETPDFGSRYYTFSLNAADSSSDGSLGQRTHGHRLPPLFIHGPRWHGRVPAGMVEVRAPTRYFQLAGRILVRGPQDYPEVHALQDRLRLTRYADWRRGLHTPPPLVTQRPLLDPAVPVPDDLVFLANLGQVLRDWWPGAADHAWIARARRLGIGADGFRPERLAPAARAAVARGLAEGRAAVEQASHRLGTQANGWTINYRGPRFGTDTLLRAAVAKDEIFVAVPEEALYPIGRVDREGAPLDGSHRYTITMPADAMPPVGAFWSITMYDDAGFMVENPLHRYSVGDRTSGIVRRADGSVVIALSHEAPGASDVNWLPAPAGRFYLMMRLYQPGPAALDGRWLPPPIVRESSAAPAG